MRPMLRSWAPAREALSTFIITGATPAAAPVATRGSAPEHMEVPEPVPVSAMENENTLGRPGAIVEEQCVGAGEVAISDDVRVLVEAPPGMCVLLLMDTIGDLGTVLCAAIGHVKEEDAADDVVEEDAEEAADDASLTTG